MRFLIVTLSVEMAKEIESVLRRSYQLPPSARIDWAKVHKVSWWNGNIKARWNRSNCQFCLADYTSVIVDARLPEQFQARIYRWAERLGVWCVRCWDPRALSWEHWTGNTERFPDPQDNLDTNELVVCPLDTNRSLMESLAEHASTASGSEATPVSHKTANGRVIFNFDPTSDTNTDALTLREVPDTGPLDLTERQMAFDLAVNSERLMLAGDFWLTFRGCRGSLVRTNQSSYRLTICGPLPPVLSDEDVQHLLEHAQYFPMY